MSLGDCQSCGACCFSTSDCYVPLTPFDRQRIEGHTAEPLIVEAGDRLHLRMVDGRCAALVTGGQRFACSIYAARPDACRSLSEGSAACFEEKKLKIRVARQLAT